MIQQFPCSVCHKSIGDKENSIFCDLCKLWIHIKCNNLNYVDYQYLSGYSDPWYCLNWNSEYTFSNLNKENFMSFIRENLTDSLKLNNLNSTSTSVWKQPAKLSQLFTSLIILLKITQTKILIILWNADIMILKKFRLWKFQIKESPYLCFILIHAILARILMI